ncbi:hypothetical protein DFJ73DRAFT_763015 [Zopfochytrium polystomum]|nr:hypothetical protein DFJ73DRAFT_763015 [Zopfochytrium polystomum]
MAVVSLVTRSVLQRRKQLLTILLALFLVCNLAVFQCDALVRSAATLRWSGTVANIASIPRTIHQTWKTSTSAALPPSTRTASTGSAPETASTPGGANAIGGRRADCRTTFCADGVRELPGAAGPRGEAGCR